MQMIPLGLRIFSLRFLFLSPRGWYSNCIVIIMQRERILLLRRSIFRFVARIKSKRINIIITYYNYNCIYLSIVRSVTFIFHRHHGKLHRLVWSKLEEWKSPFIPFLLNSPLTHSSPFLSSFFFSLLKVKRYLEFQDPFNSQSESLIFLILHRKTI